MMLKKFSSAWLFIILSIGAANAQPRHTLGEHLSPATVAVTYNAERTKISPSHCGCFWFQGAAADANWEIWNHLSLAAELSGEHASNISPGNDISKIDFLFGPRYTWQPATMRHAKHRASLFGEFLIGGVHAFNTVIPTSTGTVDSASAFALQTGAGANLQLTPHFGVRLIELDYTYSQLPNSADSIQNGFRIATGVVWHLR